MAKGNSINEGTTGVCGFTGTGFTSTPVIQNSIQIGGSTSSTLANVTVVDNGVLITNAIGVPSLLANGVTGQVLTATTGSPPSWAAPSGSLLVNVTAPGAYPYTTLATDNVIIVDTTSARTITPLASPSIGQVHRIKDNVGSAAANNITITPSGKNIDGSASYIINTNYGSIDIVYNGTQWNVL